MQNITIALILGTARPGAWSRHAAAYVENIAKQYENVEVVFVDPRGFSFPGDGDKPGDKDPKYGEIITRADAYFIVTPEYNHSIPGSLKRMLDSEYGPYIKKPVALAGVSDGSWGGTRVCEALLPVCHRLGMVNILSELYFPKVRDIFDESGQMNEQYREMYDKNIRRSLDELLWFARLLKSAK